MQLIKIISTQVDKANRRLAKFLRYGKNDTQTALQVGPPGVDANPIKDMIAVYSQTSEKGDTVVIGYINKNQLAGPGEHRIFSLDENGVVKATMHLKSNGVNQFTGNSIEFLGNTKTLAKFEELKTGFDQLKTDFNNHLQKWNTFATAYTPGSSSSVGTPPTAQTSSASTASIDNSKAENLKTA
jgi:hypothetical protein